MPRLLAILLCLLMGATGHARENTVCFKGAAEKERVRVLGLIEDCRELELLVSRVGTWDSTQTNRFWAPRHPDEWCGTGDRSFVVRTLRYSKLSEHVDLDVIAGPNGLIWAAFITEKTGRQGVKSRLNRLFARQPGEVNWAEVKK